MSDSLKSDLMEVDGVGEATSEKLISILEDGGYLDSGGNDAYLSKARDAAERGDYREAGIYLRRTNGGK